MLTIISFNPRSREGSDAAVPVGHDERVVFQSTLPRGERHGMEWPQKTSNVSIHAPARGATSAKIGASASTGFNPRSREGSDSGGGL